jgi:curved DNA-binding protein CbpA
VQTAFRTKAMEVHPDQNQDDRGCYCLPSLLGYHISCLLVDMLTSVIYLMNPLSGTEAAEERFKEVVKSYEAIKLERKNG